jgi:hypothetical protein
MTETVTITHHADKPEYKWEIVVPDGPTVLLREASLSAALGVLGISGDGEVLTEIEALPNGGSRSMNAELGEPELKHLVSLGVKTVKQS